VDCGLRGIGDPGCNARVKLEKSESLLNRIEKSQENVTWNDLKTTEQKILRDAGWEEWSFNFADQIAGGVRNATFLEDLPLYVAELIIASGIGFLGPAILPPVLGSQYLDCKTDGKCDAAQYLGMMYRNASGTADSLTPRPGIDDIAGGGLSFWNSLDALNPGKYVVVDASKLQQLKAVLDNNPIGHITVSPATLQELQAWAATRGSGIVHGFTQELLNALVSILKK